jgi:RNA polymerase sigma factor (sigma-70 family)
MHGTMSDVTRILSQIDQGDPAAAEQLLPLVYDELRKLAAARLAQEQPGQTLQATALVHEVYMRLVGKSVVGESVNQSPTDQPIHRPPTDRWDSRGHFFAAAAEAMRRILVEQARSKHRLKRAGDRQRIDLDQVEMTSDSPAEELLAVHEALEQLEREDRSAAELVKLRYFAGLSLTEAAAAIGISRTTAYEQWAYARAWLRCALASDEQPPLQ